MAWAEKGYLWCRLPPCITTWLQLEYCSMRGELLDIRLTHSRPLSAVLDTCSRRVSDGLYT